MRIDERIDFFRACDRARARACNNKQTDGRARKLLRNMTDFVDERGRNSGKKKVYRERERRTHARARAHDRIEEEEH